jgi:hypothetical protein
VAMGRLARSAGIVFLLAGICGRCAAFAGIEPEATGTVK